MKNKSVKIISILLFLVGVAGIILTYLSISSYFIKKYLIVLVVFLPFVFSIISSIFHKNNIVNYISLIVYLLIYCFVVNPILFPEDAALIITYSYLIIILLYSINIKFLLINITFINIKNSVKSSHLITIILYILTLLFAFLSYSYCVDKLILSNNCQYINKEDREVVDSYIKDEIEKLNKHYNVNDFKVIYINRKNQCACAFEPTNIYMYSLKANKFIDGDVDFWGDLWE